MKCPNFGSIHEANNKVNKNQMLQETAKREMEVVGQCHTIRFVVEYSELSLSSPMVI